MSQHDAILSLFEPETMYKPCRIELLGPLRVVRTLPGGITENIDRFHRPKAAGLLALLGFRFGRAWGREEIIELLWPEMSPDAARDNLSTMLSGLRRQLEFAGTPAIGSVVLADRQTISLNPDTVTTDIVEWERGSSAAIRSTDINERATLWEQVVALYRGAPLPGLYEDWAMTEQTRWSERYLDGLGKWSDALEAAGKTPLALEVVERCLTADPLRETAHRQKMRLLARQGQSEDALRVFGAWERRLREEMGAAPAPETRALANRIREEATTSISLPSGTAPTTQTTTSGAEPAVPSTPESCLSPENTPPIPLPLTRLFGRSPESDRLTAWLSDPDGPRLITLLGAGGCGKTRLCLEVARRLAEPDAPFSRRVYFAPLADLPIAALIPGAITRAMGLPPTTASGIGPLEQATEQLAGRRVLLVLDNLEHLLQDRVTAKGDAPAGSVSGSAVRFLRHLLERCSPGLRILVTSRRLVGLAEEQIFPVPALSIPTTSSGLSPTTLLDSSPALALFVDRARAVKPDFALTEANAPVVVQICQRLEGIPLALELAASWARVLPPAKILERLTTPLPFLVSRRRDLPSRHLSLRATIGWSYELLEPELRTLFSQLSVFRGGWTLESAEAVVGEEDDLLTGLARLEEQSLILAIEQPDDACVRWRMLEPLRDFAEEVFDAEEQERLHRSHQRYFFAEAKQRDPSYQTDATAALSWLDQEHDNIRTALAWSISASPAEAQAFCDDILKYWEFRGHFVEGRQWCASALAAPGGQDLTIERGIGLNAAATLAFEQGDIPAARALLEEAVVLHRTRGDNPKMLTNALNNLAGTLLEQREFDAAEALYREALSVTRPMGWFAQAAGNVLNLALIALRRGEFPQLEQLALEGRTLAIQGESDFHLMYAEGLCGYARLEQRDFPGAESAYRAQLRLSHRMGNAKQTAIVLGSLGTVAHAQHHPEQAARLFAAADTIFERLQVPRYRGNAPDTPGPYEELQAERVQNPEGAIALAWQEGRGWDDAHIATLLQSPSAS